MQQLYRYWILPNKCGDSPFMPQGYELIKRKSKLVSILTLIVIGNYVHMFGDCIEFVNRLVSCNIIIRDNSTICVICLGYISGGNVG